MKVATAPSRSTLGAAVSTPDSQEPKKTGAPVSGVTRPDPQPVNKKEFVGRVAKRADLRPNQVRAATEAALEELGRALSNGEELKLPGLGKLQVKRKKDIGKAEVMVCKIRRKKDEESETDPLAPAAE
ncbi:HU family DNA-binding protein [Aliiroseovarius crassostreae]|uniref:HU family DNA-binding protein n=1 Tax=Aliiroseovarius crassostreae TaxID=154981 RepID=UPI003C7E5805